MWIPDFSPPLGRLQIGKACILGGGTCGPFRAPGSLGCSSEGYTPLKPQLGRISSSLAPHFEIFDLASLANHPKAKVKTTAWRNVLSQCQLIDAPWAVPERTRCWGTGKRDLLRTSPSLASIHCVTYFPLQPLEPRFARGSDESRDGNKFWNTRNLLGAHSVLGTILSPL